MAKARSWLILACLQASACTGTSQSSAVQEEPPPSKPAPPADPWRRAFAPEFVPCAGVVGSRRVDVESLGEVETDSPVVERLDYDENWRWPHRVSAIRRAHLSYSLDGLALYAVMAEGTPKPRLLHCTVLLTVPEDEDEVSIASCSAGAGAEAPADRRAEFVGLMDGASRVYTDLDALSQCAPMISDALEEFVDEPWDLRFVEQLSTSSGQQRWVLVQLEEYKERRTELLTFEVPQ